jgi:aminomethyltransferase
MTEKAIPRQGMPIEGGGEVTSGTQSPMHEIGIGMGYVPAEASTPGTELVIDVGGQPRRAEVSKKPPYKKASA